MRAENDVQALPGKVYCWAGTHLVNCQQAEGVGGILLSVQLPQKTLGSHVTPWLPCQRSKHQAPLVALSMSAVPKDLRGG